MNSLISVLLNAQKFDQAELILREILDFIKKHKSPKEHEIGSTLCIIASLQKLKINIEGFNKIKNKLKDAEYFY